MSIEWTVEVQGLTVGEIIRHVSDATSTQHEDGYWHIANAHASLDIEEEVTHVDLWGENAEEPARQVFGFLAQHTEAKIALVNESGDTVQEHNTSSSAA